jgi:hypothetical protein
VSGQIQAPAVLTPGKDPRYALNKKLSGPQSLSGRYGEVKILGRTRAGTPKLGCAARSQSLLDCYRVCHWAHKGVLGLEHRPLFV